MLERVGAESIDHLLDFIPSSIRLRRSLDLPPAMSEWSLARHLGELAAKNETADSHICFLGGGVYDHHIPEVVNTIASRGEFLTAYTPYQPEISQGLLRVLFDFQLAIGRLFDMPVVNCSVYDGATALAESAWMAVSATGVNRLVLVDTLWPEHLEVLRVYMENRNVSIDLVKADSTTGAADVPAVRAALEQPAAAVIIQTPNCQGVIEPIEQLVELAHERKSLAVVGCYPTALGILPAPGSCDADIVYAEGQCLGLPLSGGGPYLGLIGTRDSLVDYLPGRLVGETRDIKGEPALALIKQEREQHVRRHEATSHICSNQALMALRVLVYLSLLGETGLRRVATLCAQKAHYLCSKLCAIEGVSRSHQGAFFNEFAVNLPVEAAPLLEELRSRGFHGGMGISQGDRARVLIAVSETKSQQDLNQFTEAFAEAIGGRS